MKNKVFVVYDPQNNSERNLIEAFNSKRSYYFEDEDELNHKKFSNLYFFIYKGNDVNEMIEELRSFLLLKEII